MGTGNINGNSKAGTWMIIHELAASAGAAPAAPPGRMGTAGHVNFKL